MIPKASALLILLPILLLISTSTVSAFNITAILDQYPDFSGFNAILNQTGLAKEINSRTTLTVLAVDGSGIGSISGLPIDDQKRILSVHVILDYYDTTKFQSLKKKSTSLTTLFQTTGKADQRQGFLNMTKGASGEILFGSAMPGSPLNARYIKTVLAKPYNISVLQVSRVVVPPGITNLPITPSPYLPPPPPDASAPTPVPSETEESAPAEAPAADAPEADAPEADAPEAEAPAADAPGPAKAEVADKPKEDVKSDAEQVAVGAGVVVVIMMGAALLGL